MSLITDDAEHV